MFRRTLLPLLVLAVAALGQPVVTQVLNAASYSEVVAPGCWIAVFGAGLAPSIASAPSVPLPKKLVGVSVTIDGQDAPLLYVSPGQINALIPFEVPAGDNRKTSVTVSTDQGTSAPYTIYVNRRAPALFTRDSSGTGMAHAFDANFRSVDGVNPGDVIILYAAGLGPTDPPASTEAGGSASEPLSRVTDQVDVFLGDQKAEVLFAGLAPGFPGVYQLNVRIPAVLWTNRLYLREYGWLSNITQVGISSGNNVAGVVIADIDQVFPARAYSSFPFVGASFRLQVDVHPGASAFPVAMVGEAGGWFARVDPANGMWQSFFTTPSIASMQGDFSIGSSERPLLIDFGAGCIPFPNNVIAVSRLDPAERMFMNYTLSPPMVTLPGKPTGMLEQHGPYASGGAGLITTAAFGDFITLPCGSQKTRTTTFTIYVDGEAVAARDVTFPIAGR